MDLCRSEALIGKSNLKKIKNLNILIIGLGGVGGYTLESLIRNGVENITIIDGDKISSSNINRQIISLNNNIGNYKVFEWEKRAKLINKDINIKSINKMITIDDLNNIDLSKYNYIVDACDSVNLKVDLIIKAKSEKLNLISSMGMGNKLDSTKLYLTTLNKTEYDPLAKKIRNILKKKNITSKTIVVSSKESVKVKNKAISSICHVPATAGLLITSYIINDVINS